MFSYNLGYALVKHAKYSDKELLLAIDRQKALLGLNDLSVSLSKRDTWPAMRIDFDDPKSSAIISYAPKLLPKRLKSTNQQIDDIIAHELSHVLAARAGASSDAEHDWIASNRPEFALPESRSVSGVNL